MSDGAAAPAVGYVPTGRALLYYREVGTGEPIIVLHGGPDFDHSYLLPELDRLASSFRLIYYDQRGRGRSADDVRPEDVTLLSEIDDLEAVRSYFELESVAVLGHSWGAVLAMEYAIRHPDRVSHLILLNPAPASRNDSAMLRDHLRRVRPAGDVERMQAISATDRFRRGDIEAEAEYYRIHYRPALATAEQVERVVGRLRSNFTAAGILTARAIEERLYTETWLSDGYDLIPQLREIAVPALVIHGEHDFIPVDVSVHIADAIPNADLRMLPRCGHFAYLEFPDLVHEHVTALLTDNRRRS